ncbi:MAG TPA: DUF402 domain-containing protein [Spirochaetota bacterium]|nr:DUF402 domain-containing protein [Spirochaetota bacterium]
MFDGSKSIVVENWIKPPKLVQYENAKLLSYENNELICNFLFPGKYSNSPFFINGEKILESKEMYWGKRYFYSDRFYSLLEYYSIDDKITAYYIDISLPAYIESSRVFITDLKIDFWVMPDKKRYIILDEDELQDAISENLFSEIELMACYETVDFIKSKLDKNNFNGIFNDYKISHYKEWERYERYLINN